MPNKIGKISYGRAVIRNKSFNKDARTFDVTIATERPVYRNYWYMDTPFNEVLSCVTENIRLERAASGLPLFDNHRAGGITTQLGIVTGIRIENKELIGTVTLGARADEATISDIENGIISGVSVGYNIYKYQREVVKGQMDTYTALDWEPLEVSLAPVQADIDSKIRSNKEHEILIVKSRNDMDEIEQIRQEATDEQKNDWKISF